MITTLNFAVAPRAYTMATTSSPDGPQELR